MGLQTTVQQGNLRSAHRTVIPQSGVWVAKVVEALLYGL